MRRRTFLLGGAAALGVAACGLPDDNRPRVLGDDDLPRDLSESAQAPANEAGGDRVDLFFLLEGERPALQAVSRRVDQSTPENVINALLQGLIAQQDPAGLTTAIPRTTSLLGSRLEGPTLLLDLGPGSAEGGITSIDGPLQVQAFAQIVWTATGLEAVDQVVFFVLGQPIGTLVGDGAVNPGDPVRRADYAFLAPGTAD